MVTKYAKHVAKRGPTPQSEPIPGREVDQVKNQAGGFVFELSDWSRLDRFLILGAEGNTYYATEKKMTVGNAQAAMRCIKEDGEWVVARIVEISHEGRAPKNDPALFVLALCASADDVKTRQAALRALPKIARIGTHLFHFADYVSAQRGWGRALRRAIGDWYNEKDVARLAEQVSKYQQRDGWSNRDLLRLSHPKTGDAMRKAIYDWACGRKLENTALPAMLKAVDILAAEPKVQYAVDCIEVYGLPRESIPTELLNDVDVWRALLQKMPLTAMTRNLGRMSSIGLLKQMGADNKRVLDALGSEEAIRKARLHPIQLLIALKTYAQGRGDKGKLFWTPVPQVIDALDKAFYTAFKTIQPTGKRILLALDVSGSMGGGNVAGTSLTPRDASAALALVTAATEPNYGVVGFTGGGGGYYGSRSSNPDGLTHLTITPRMRLDQVVKTISGLPFGSTDCALPMLYASKNKLEVDAFVIYTDNETWAGGSHPVQALADYRKKTGINAKLVVCGMTATQFSIADPKDDGMMDVVGFDTATPQIIADFIRG